MNGSPIFFPEGETESGRTAALGLAATLAHPDDVVNDPRLKRAEKKAILASWSSDARAVENAPSLRRLDSGAIVEVDTIMQALRALDAPHAGAKRRTFATHRPGVISSLLRRGGSPTHADDDDDDDPPPAPASMAVRYRPSFLAAHAGRAAVAGLAR